MHFEWESINQHILKNEEKKIKYLSNHSTSTIGKRFFSKLKRKIMSKQLWLAVTSQVIYRNYLSWVHSHMRNSSKTKISPRMPKPGEKNQVSSWTNQDREIGKDRCVSWCSQIFRERLSSIRMKNYVHTLHASEWYSSSGARWIWEFDCIWYAGSWKFKRLTLPPLLLI